MGLRAVIRDDHGNFVVAFFSCPWGSLALFVGETKALVEGLLLAMELAGPIIKLQSNSQILALIVVNNRVDHFNNFGLVLQEI